MRLWKARTLEELKAAKNKRSPPLQVTQSFSKLQTFPYNPLFKPHPVYSNHSKQVIIHHYQREPNLRSTSYKFHVSIPRVNAILALKCYEAELKRKVDLLNDQTTILGFHGEGGVHAKNGRTPRCQEFAR